MDKQIIKDLCNQAVQAAKNAHAPYSDFPVGAALLTEAGKTYHGCNVESSSYGLTICAERNAIASAVVQGEKKFKAMAIYSNIGAAPCGACRQVIWDICGDIDIYSIDNKGKVLVYTSAELLPKPFDESQLKRDK
ncbi:MAG: cytidine deaminase [Fidelibacterota bacterium]